jgi:hypothetical protein
MKVNSRNAEKAEVSQRAQRNSYGKNLATFAHTFASLAVRFGSFYSRPFAFICGLQRK